MGIARLAAIEPGGIVIADDIAAGPGRRLGRQRKARHAQAENERRSKDASMTHAHFLLSGGRGNLRTISLMTTGGRRDPPLLWQGPVRACIVHPCPDPGKRGPKGTIVTAS